MGFHSRSVFTKLYEVSILSVFNYTAHIWSFNRSVLTLPKKIQNNSLRFFFGLGKAAPIAALLGDSGWPPIEIYLQFTLITWWFHLGNMSMDRIPKVVYKSNKEFADMNNLKSWSHQVKQMVSPIDKILVVLSFIVTQFGMLCQKKSGGVVQGGKGS